ncbi:MAG: 50S ribosomal protein L4 [Spirochaetes bacterium DG_61]|nr:MAG: 50S ribosomal protein L4 [Spirochaetes bacterium DG_61]
MDVTVYNVQGKEKGTTNLSDEVFNIKPNKNAIYYSLRAELANERMGTASTKVRSEVRGSGAKPWRQKGTGRARAGSRQSPIWVGGGAAFGPKPRSYKIRLPKKMKRESVKSLLSLKMGESALKVVEDFTVESGKTRDFSALASRLVDIDRKRRVLIIDREPSRLNKRAGRNIPWLKYYNADLLNTKDLYHATQLILTESAVQLLNEKYS